MVIVIALQLEDGIKEGGGADTASGYNNQQPFTKSTLFS